MDLRRTRPLLRRIGRNRVARGTELSAVVIAALGDPDLVVDHLVDESALIGNSPRPVPLKAVFEGLGFTNAVIAVSLNILNQLIDASQNFAVFSLPSDVVFPGPLIPK